MECKQVEELLGALCEGSLGEQSVREVENHIASCARCAREKTRIARTLDALRMFEQIEPRKDFSARLWQRIDAWEASRRVMWLTAVTAFVRRNRRVLVTCCTVFVISLVSSVFVLRHMSTTPGLRVAEEERATEGFVIREIPQPVSTDADTAYLHFVTGDRPARRDPQADDYVFKPVVRPVSDAGPAF